MTKRNLYFLIPIIFVLFVFAGITSMKYGWLNITKQTLGTTMVQFPGEDITIRPEDLQKMSNEELVQYGVLLFYIERFDMTQEETHYLAYRLLPRIFAKPQATKTQE